MDTPSVKQCSVNLLMSDGTVQYLEGTPEEVAELIHTAVKEEGSNTATIIPFPARGRFAHPSYRGQ